MSAQYRIFGTPGYLHLHVSGQVTAEGYFECFAGLAEDEAFYPSIPTLIEVGYDAKVAIGNMDMDEAKKMGEVVGRLRAGEPYRLAVAGGPPDTRSFVSMAQEIVSSEGAEARAFDSVLEASQWLWKTKGMGEDAPPTAAD